MKRYAALGCPSVVVANDNAVLQTSSGTTEDVLNTLMSQPAYAAIGIASRFLVDVSEVCFVDLGKEGLGIWSAARYALFKL